MRLRHGNVINTDLHGLEVSGAVYRRRYTWHCFYFNNKRELETMALRRQPLFLRAPAQSLTRPLNLQQQIRPESNLYKKLFRKWTGKFSNEHAVNRKRVNDTTDPGTAAVNAGMEDRRESEFIADPTKSEATTERGGLRAERKAKEEHPKAPEPVIGMNDERARVGFTLSCLFG